MAVAEEAVDQSADEQFFHTYGYYPTAYTYSAPVAVKTVKYAAPTVKYVAPTVKTVQYAAPYAYQYGAYPYAAAYQPYAVKSLLPATYGLILMVLILMVPTHTVTPSTMKKRRKKNRFPQLFQSYTRSTTSRIFTTNQTYQHEKKNILF